MKFLQIPKHYRNKKTVLISTKENTQKSKIAEIDRILQVECGFVNTKKNEWKKDMPSILNMNRRREENVGGMMPEQTFEVCNKCGITAITTQTVSDIIGYRKTNGKIITQPNCHKCRSVLSRSPKQRTGPNKKRMVRSSLLVGDSQTKLGYNFYKQKLYEGNIFNNMSEVYSKLSDFTHITWKTLFDIEYNQDLVKDAFLNLRHNLLFNVLSYCQVYAFDQSFIKILLEFVQSFVDEQLHNSNYQLNAMFPNKKNIVDRLLWDPNRKN